LRICIDSLRYVDNIRQLGMKAKVEKQELDYREKEIRDYILQNQKTRLTENQVVLAMHDKGVCSRITCLKKIRRLKERGILEDIKEKQNNFSWLVIKDQNEFSLISKQLTEIESVIKVAAEPVRKLFEASDLGNSIFYFSYNVNFLFPYLETVSTMLRVLLIRTDEMIQSKNDCQALHTRIINLMTQITLQAYDLDNAKKLLFVARTKLNYARDQLKDPGTKNDFISFEKVDKVIKTLDNFQAIFLPETKSA
jgi:hypothetical protein